MQSHRRYKNNPITNEDRVPGFIKMSHHERQALDKPNIAYTDYAFLDGDKNLVSIPVRRVEVLSVFNQKDKEYCRVMFEGRKYQIPASRLYRRQERYSPSHIPERIDINKFQRESPQKS
jgi:hypothetical protein